MRFCWILVVMCLLKFDIYQVAPNCLRATQTLYVLLFFKKRNLSDSHSEIHPVRRNIFSTKQFVRTLKNFTFSPAWSVSDRRWCTKNYFTIGFLIPQYNKNIKGWKLFFFIYLPILMMVNEILMVWLLLFLEILFDIVRSILYFKVLEPYLTVFIFGVWICSLLLALHWWKDTENYYLIVLEDCHWWKNTQVLKINCIIQFYSFKRAKYLQFSDIFRGYRN